MARYTGPTTRIARKFGEPIYGPDKNFEKRNTPPGQHGLASKRKKVKEYGTQLKEKQKVKYMYGVLERQFRNTYARAARMKGQTGENLLFLLESRLDNLVYRLGIAPTRAAARQLVGHKHIVVDGQVVNIPSYIVKPGQVVGVREKNKTMSAIVNALANPRLAASPWLEWNEQAMAGTFVRVPERAEIPETIDEQAIVELYSR